MDAKFIAAVGGGFALILCARFIFAPAIRNAHASSPTRILIDAEVRGRHGSRGLIWAEIPFILAIIFTFPSGYDRATLLCLYFFMLLTCIAGRTIFREMRIAAEAELAVRKQKESSNPPLEPTTRLPAD
ncbi:MAG: hypothetical protein ACTHMB_24070 [Candidatus Binatia bacterium]